MKHFIKKLYVAITLLSVMSVGHVFADYRNSLSCGENEDCNPCQPTCSRAYIGAELLYWRAFQNGLDICVPTDVSDTVTDGEVISTFRGEGHEPNFEWHPGFRINVGFEMPSCNKWDIATTWTHFHSHVHGSHHGDRPHWNINLDVVDVVAGYRLDLGDCFTVRPFAGLRVARIDQKIHIVDFADGTDFGDLISEDVNNKERFRGIGPLLGLEANWNMGCNFSLYANASISWLYGKFHVRQTEFEDVVGASNFCEVEKHLNGTQAIADVGLGIRWQTCFCMNTQLIIQLGLEHHRYFDHNRIGCYGDLSFDGLNLGAGLAF